MSRSDATKWDARYREGSHTSRDPSAFLLSLDDLLPRQGRALDVAGGVGRNALWLAQRGLEVTLADVSPVGLSMARERAAEAGLVIRTVEIDLESEPLPVGPWDLLVKVLYFQPTLFGAIHEVLAPGGLLVFLQPTVHNCEAHDRPPSPFLLKPGQARELLGDFEIVRYEEGWRDGYHEARVLARKPIR
jgi:SAM-dependent methyltransferase